MLSSLAGGAVRLSALDRPGDFGRLTACCCSNRGVGGLLLLFGVGVRLFRSRIRTTGETDRDLAIADTLAIAFAAISVGFVATLRAPKFSADDISFILLA